MNSKKKVVRRKRTKKARRPIKAWQVVAIALIAGIAALGAWAWGTASARYSGKEPVRFYLPEGTTEQAAGDTLLSVFGPKFGNNILQMWRLRGRNMNVAAGSYVVKPGETALSVGSRLHNGAQTPVKLTFNNVRTLNDLAERISAKFAFDKDDFLAAADSVLPTMGYSAREQFPAAFTPDTYEFYWTEPADRVIRRLADETSKFWTPERLKKAQKLGLTPVEVATVASIVDEETASAAERPVVARLYLNRLASGMKLQADPTVKFALGDFSLRRIYGKMLTFESPYNTYVHAGLPPGPIRIVERADLDAVLNAPAHNYIYMCAKPDFSGTHNFTADYAEHLRNAAAYRAALDRKSIK